MLDDVMEKAQAYGAHESEVFWQETSTGSVRFEDSRLKSVDSSQSRGMAIRVVADGRIGFATASDMGKAREMARQAVESAWQCEKTEIAFPSVRPEKNGLKMEDEAVSKLQPEAMAESAENAIRRLNEYDPSVLAFGGIGKGEMRIRVKNTTGLDAEYRKTLLSGSVGGQLIVGTNILFCYRDAASTSASVAVDELTERVIADFEMSRTTVPFEGGPKTVVFTPRAACALFDVLRMGINGKNVEKGTSPIRDKLGARILSEKLTVIEDGLLEEGVGSAPFDDEGTPLGRKTVVDHGVLRCFAVDLRTAPKLNVAPSGNGFRFDRYTGWQSYESPPAPQSTNWLLSPAERSYGEILGEVEDGVVVDLMMGLFTGNLLSGDFSANLMLAYRINKGKIVGRIKNAMVSGNFYEIFRDNVVGVSRDTERVASGATTNVFPYLCANDLMIST
ncbi:MAG: TldD/PmbA family protein [bacterium]|nr:TldD/PmbA family protein [bacterium]